MARGKRVKPEQAVAIIRKIEIMMAEGASVDEACKKAEISNQSYYRWKKEYAGMDVDQANRYQRNAMRSVEQTMKAYFAKESFAYQNNTAVMAIVELQH